MSTNSSKQNPKKRGVRFAASAQVREVADVGGDRNDDEKKGPPPRKRPRLDRPNEDEIDDVDDWEPDGEDEIGGEGGEGLPTERDALEARRRRRLKRQLADNEDDAIGEEVDVDGAGETRIDATTSLAEEGVPIEPFNMSQETSDGTGYFDGDTFVFRRGGRDEDDEPDAWADGLSADDSAANKNKKQRQRRSEESEDSEEEESTNAPRDPIDDWTNEELLAKILPLVSDTETVAQAIVRYGNLLKRTAPSRGSGGKATEGGLSSAIDKKAGEAADGSKTKSRDLAHAALNDVTEAANALLLKGKVVDIYQKTRNDILKMLPASGHETNGASNTANNNTANINNNTGGVVHWEYQGSQDQQIHGPYTTEQMVGWIGAGYFVGPSAVKVRTIREASEEAQEPKKTIQEDLLSDLMDDDEEEVEDKKPSPKRIVRGDWLMSDQVDFSKYA